MRDDPTPVASKGLAQHDRAVIAHLCEGIGVMSHGRLVEITTATDGEQPGDARFHSTGIRPRKERANGM